jgi:hypothetical protein
MSLALPLMVTIEPAGTDEPVAGDVIAEVGGVISFYWVAGKSPV